MKKLLLLLCAPFLFLAANAQSPITITSADIAVIGKVIKQATDTSTTITPGTSGTNKTWNFSTLAISGEDSLIFTNPNWTPNGNKFPSSNLAAITQRGTVYLNNSSTGLMLNGFSDSAIFLTVNPAEKLISFPSTYNTTFSMPLDVLSISTKGNPIFFAHQVKE